MQEEIIKKKFGFLYTGYCLHYWETVEMIRKLALAAIPVFVKPQPTGSLQAVIGEVVLVSYLFAVTYFRPYISAADNNLHMGSLAGRSQPLVLSVLHLQVARAGPTGASHFQNQEICSEHSTVAMAKSTVVPACATYFYNAQPSSRR